MNPNPKITITTKNSHGSSYELAVELPPNATSARQFAEGQARSLLTPMFGSQKPILLNNGKKDLLKQSDPKIVVKLKAYGHLNNRVTPYWYDYYFVVLNDGLD